MMRGPADQIIPEFQKPIAPIFYQYLAAFTCSILSFVYGSAIGWTSSAIPQLQDGVLAEGAVSLANSGWIGGALCLGALITSPFHGLLADAKGRKFAVYVTAAALIINWSFVLAADSLWCILVARFFCGIGAAGTVTVVSIYNNEIAEIRLKASMGGLMSMTYACGILFAYMIGAWVSYFEVIVVNLCISILFLPAWWIMPESPAYQVLNGKDKEAMAALQWLLGSDGSHAQDAFNRLKKEQAGAVQSASIMQFFRDPAARRGLAYASILIAAQVFSGMFAVNSYAGSILSRAGGGLTPTAGTLLYGSLMVAGSVFPPLIADRLPRRLVLGVSCSLMCTAMAVLATFMFLQSQGWNLSDPGSFLGLIPAVALSASVFFYYTGLGSTVFIAIVELFTDETRGVAGAFVSGVLWSTAFFLLQFFEIAVEAFGDYSVFYFFSAVCALGVFFIWVFLPETRGKSVEEISSILRKR